jgi:predicted ATPase
MSHPFGDLLSQHLHRKHGLSQSKLAEGILQAPTIITGMAKGRRLTGPQARERVIAIIGWLHQQGVLATRSEANALLTAAGMAPLYPEQPTEARLLRLLPDPSIAAVNTAIPPAPIGTGEPSKPQDQVQQVSPVHLPEQPSATRLNPNAKGQNHNLPAQLTPFVGRSAEISQVSIFLADPSIRLLTLIGPGGIGKTRLALAVATTQVTHFAHGVYFLSLAAVDSAYAIPSLIADALNFTPYGDETPYQQLCEYLRPKEMLLVLDNFEHLLAAPTADAAELDSVTLLLELLQIAPRLKVLITSRNRLNVQGEQLLALDGVDFPPDQQTPLLLAQQSSAVTLFVQSARSVQPDFQLTTENLSAVVRICQWVQGMPLAILLAAAWVTVLTPAEILAELQASDEAAQSLDFLSTDLRDLPARQRSLRRVFDHSWQLLTAEEQTIFAQLAIFRNGFTHQAAEEIVDFGFLLSAAPPTPASQNPKAKTQTILRTFLNKSLIRRQPGQVNGGRYDLHELVRQYAAERLAQMADKGEGLRARHSRFYIRLLAEQEARMHGAEGKAALAIIDRDLDNIRIAWHWAVDHPETPHLPLAMRCLGYFYEARHRYQEAESAYGSAVRRLDALPQLSPALQLELAKALAWHGAFSCLLGRWQESEQRLQRSLRLLQQAGLEERVYQTVSAFVFLQFGRLFDTQAKLAESEGYYQQALLRYQAVGEAWGQAHAHLGLGILAYRIVAYARARQHYETSLAHYRQLGDDQGSARVLAYWGYICRDQGDFVSAQRLTSESLALYERLGDRAAIANGQLSLGWLYLYLGRFHEAYAVIEQASLVFEELRLPAPFMAFNAMLAVANLELGRYPLAYEQLQKYQQESSNTNQRHEVAFGYLLLSMLATIEKEYTQAEQLALDARAFFTELNDLDRLALAIVAQGFAARGLGKTAVSWQCFTDALQSAVDHHSFTSITFALAGAALMLADQGQHERAVEVYAQLSQLPVVANSKLRWDLAGAQMAAVAASLPPEVVSAIYARATIADLWATAAGLLVAPALIKGR